MTDRDQLRARIVKQIEHARREGYDEIEFSTPPQQTPEEIADQLLDGLAVLDEQAAAAHNRNVRASEAEQCAEAVEAYAAKAIHRPRSAYHAGILDMCSEAAVIIRHRIPSELRAGR